MRIWDINPGYLHDKSLLGEHRELHAIVSILSKNKKGYSRHPETLSKKKAPGRIPLPKSKQELWAQHKYSVLAHDTKLYQTYGKLVVGLQGSELFSELSGEFTNILKTRPLPPRMLNALQHMWGYVSDYWSRSNKNITLEKAESMLFEIQGLSKKHNINYLLSSTSLSEMGAWI